MEGAIGRWFSCSGRVLLFTAAVAAAALCLLVPLSSLAQQASLPSAAPVNPAFLEYQEKAAAGLTESAPGEFGLGYVSSPMDYSHLRTRREGSRGEALTLPSSYDLRTYGKVTAVRNQGSCGSCWTFGTMASLESYLLDGDTADFSENNLKDKHGFDWTCCAGGNADMSTAYLARWGGPANEGDDPYDQGSCASPDSVPISSHVQDVITLPGRSGSLDNDGIKEAVMTYGAVAISMNWVDGAYNSANYAFYYNGTLTSNHMVAVIGWDDDFAASKFNTPPEGNGAFLIRNSWGSYWGNAGYFWISYYDTCAARYESTVFMAQPTSGYSYAYQYDPLGATSSLGYGVDVPAWAANIFTMVAPQSIAAVSTYFFANNTSYELYIYTGCSASSPRSGTRAYSSSGCIVSAGYHTVILPSPVALVSGQRFSIVFKLNTPGYGFPVPMEYPLSGYSSSATAAAGQSFYSYDGTAWSDLTNLYANTNVCIKAFVASGVPGEIAPGTSSDAIQSWSPDKTTQSWPSDLAATGYRLYRGIPADLPNLLNGNVDSCLLADQNGTSINLSSDTLASGSFYWYVVRGYNAAGDGTAGNATAGPRHLDPSGSSCP